MKPYTKKLVLEDGREFPGYGFASGKEKVGELVFNTSMVGYQEILYRAQNEACKVGDGGVG